MEDYLSRFRAEREATSRTIPCVVTTVDLSGEPMVTVKPQVTVPYDLFDGDMDDSAPLPIEEVPYVYPSGNAFALFIPPEVGMEGFLVVTDTEVGEVASGEASASRRGHFSSGYFIPSGNLTGKAFKGSAEWAELRSEKCRVALSKDSVHLEAGETSIVLSNDGFDVLVNGVSLVEALQQMSQHIAQLEAVVHPNGYTHGGANSRLIDDISAADAPMRQETGVR